MDERKNDFVPFVPLGDRPGNGPASEQFDIDGIKIDAFYDASHRLLFVLDSTHDAILPNTLLIIGDRNGRKWDDILQNDFGIDPETIRPRTDNKYQKLDIDYDGINYYNDAIITRNADILKPVRIKIAERQKEFRINDAYHEIELARATVAEAEKTIADLDDFIKLQIGKLKAAKKNVGKEPPKDSAAKILRYEARIDRAMAKKARAARRLKRAEKRIDSSTKMLNNYKNIFLMPRGREMNENDVKPLFTEDPKIIDNDNAFKPVSFDTMPAAPSFEPQPPTAPEITQPAAMPESSNARTDAPRPASPFQAPTAAPQPPAAAPGIAPMSRPVAPMSGEVKITAENRAPKQGGAYYLMLTLLIGLSIFTLYLYQKKMGSNETPHIAATARTETITPAETAAQPPIDQQVVVAAAEPAPEPIPDVLPEDPSFIEPEIPIDNPEPVQETMESVLDEPEVPAQISMPEPVQEIEAEPEIAEQPDTLEAAIETEPEIIEAQDSAELEQSDIASDAETAPDIANDEPADTLEEDQFPDNIEE